MDSVGTGFLCADQIAVKQLEDCADGMEALFVSFQPKGKHWALLLAEYERFKKTGEKGVILEAFIFRILERQGNFRLRFNNICPKTKLVIAFLQYSTKAVKGHDPLVVYRKAVKEVPEATPELLTHLERCEQCQGVLSLEMRAARSARRPNKK